MNTPAPNWAGEMLFFVRRELAKRLHGAGIEEASIEARHLLRALFDDDASDIWLDPERCLDAVRAEQLETMVRRRERREPLSQILGSWGFWSLDLKVSREVLTPRPETERLVEIALEAMGPGPARILDLGTGSGAILLALLAERPDITAIGVDLSAAALEIAAINAKDLKLDDRVMFIEGGWAAALDAAPFDLVVSNPPYIARAIIETLEPEVRRFEPILALDGGTDGLDAYRVLLPLLHNYLKPGGNFAFEIGAAQGQSVLALASNHSTLQGLRVLPDLAGRDRVLSGIRHN